MWESKLKLNAGDTLKLVSSSSKGFMSEEDIYEYSVLDATGSVVGHVFRTDHTAVRGFRRTESVRQIGNDRTVIVDEQWTS